MPWLNQKFFFAICAQSAVFLYSKLFKVYRAIILSTVDHLTESGAQSNYQ